MYTNYVRTSQETLSPLQIQFKEIIAVYCENRMKHTDKLCGQIAQY
jgi:hypothetical protein